LPEEKKEKSFETLVFSWKYEFDLQK